MALRLTQNSLLYEREMFLLFWAHLKYSNENKDGDFTGT